MTRSRIERNSHCIVGRNCPRPPRRPSYALDTNDGVCLQCDDESAPTRDACLLQPWIHEGDAMVTSLSDGAGLPGASCPERLWGTSGMTSDAVDIGVVRLAFESLLVWGAASKDERCIVFFLASHKRALNADVTMGRRLRNSRGTAAPCDVCHLPVSRVCACDNAKSSPLRTHRYP